MTTAEIVVLVNDLALQYSLKSDLDVICGTIPLSDALYDQIYDNEVMIIDRQILPQLIVLVPTLSSGEWGLTISIASSGNEYILYLVRQ